jgi:hypothetical protein
VKLPDYFDQFPNCDMVWDEKLGLVQDWQLLLTREPFDDARDLNNIILYFKNLVACYGTRIKGCLYVMSPNVETPRFTNPDLHIINGSIIGSAHIF